MPRIAQEVVDEKRDGCAPERAERRRIDDREGREEPADQGRYEEMTK